MSYQTEDFFYNLPPELIAQEPVRPRDHCRLLVLGKQNGTRQHTHFYNLPEYLQAGDVLILNNSKVFPARLLGHKKDTKGEVEIFLHHYQSGKTWECLLKGRIKAGLEIVLSKRLQAVARLKNEDGTWLVEFNLTGNSFLKEVNRIGKIPLPPYIKRDTSGSQEKNGKAIKSRDRENYQTVFASSQKTGSVAAPTAGLHFTKSLLAGLRRQGIKIIFITLHVGLGTFSPVKVKNIKEHKMHQEFVEINERSWREILAAKQAGRRIIAAGTTSCRAVEAAAHNYQNYWIKNSKNQKKELSQKKETSQDKNFSSSPNSATISFWTDIFIYPGYRFQLVDGLITNFHLPQSTLLMLVSALAGQKNIKRAYAEAVREKYRFFSYGDAMFIF